MNAEKIKKWGLPLSLLVLAVFILSAVWWPEAKGNETPLEPTRINIALRATGDRLLDLAGDSTSTIAPVRRKDAHTWQLRLERRFNYDSLPQILRRALLRQAIRLDYNVAVLRCQDDELILGYSASGLELEGEVPCGGRELAADCLNIELSFLEKVIPQPNPWKTSFLMLSGFLFLAALGTVLYRKKTPSTSVDQPETDNPNQLRFGQSSFDFANQTLWVNGQLKNLTFREAKLLHYLIQNANQVLDRERILEAIWQDEGMLVGRSLDVFISRLRKLLQEDENIKIVSVHGVGYRFEITPFDASK
ncbi:MAG: winged helix-turn-helix domain-containing protein [Haliscomenobacter sp.]|uniref:winged helix-turn-helix domain-containing protein n=1 Tax=Haliscomenobacter sp. TaxID=2717303 RepID=UPI0029A479A8|nr:winged helix-turn-helix domain-containing protein [Haliscomenobacter sp.]MDX2069392.1 winged helix-turn-helix domain-containing protein [Haliscomenobacter sp.]